MSFFRQERNIHKKVTYLFMGGACRNWSLPGTQVNFPVFSANWIKFNVPGK